MDAIPTSPGIEFIWTKLKGSKRSFSLRDSGREYAKITWPNALRNRAIGEWANGRIIIERKGVLHPVVTLVDEAFDQEVARAAWTWQKETRVDFANGRSYLMKKQGFWNSKWLISKEDGTEIIGLRPRGVLNERGEVKVGEAKGVEDQLATLAILLWYSHTLASQESAAVTAAAGT